MYAFLDQDETNHLDVDFGKIIAGQVRRNRFLGRVATLRHSIELCLKRDGREADLTLHYEAAAKELGINPYVMDLAGSIGWPPPRAELEYLTLLYAAAAQPPLGAWSVLHFDVLTMWEDGNGLLTEIFPTIISSHPQTNFATELPSEQLIRYKDLFSSASNYFHGRATHVQTQIDALAGNLDAEAQAASSVLQMGWRALRVGIILYKLADTLAEKGIEAAEKKQAAEAERLLAEAEREKAREEMDKFVRDNFRELPNADKWLDKFDRFQDFKRTA